MEIIRTSLAAKARAAGAFASCVLILIATGCASAPAESPDAAKARAQGIVANPIRTDQDVRPLFDGDGPLCRLAQRQARDLQEGGLLLDTAGVRQHQARRRQQPRSG